eukprot:scaffold26998_cov43-Cyclotella_meneghiniana.AAC.1
MSEISPHDDDDDASSARKRRRGKTEYELPNNHDEHLANEDGVSSTVADNEADGVFYAEKKRSATEDENPGATKKIKIEEDEQIPAALCQPRLPDLILDMKNDHNYLQIINEAIKKTVGEEFGRRAEKEMGKTILHELRRDYRVLDANGFPVQDDVALHSKHIAQFGSLLYDNSHLTFSPRTPLKDICRCLRRKYYDEKKSSFPTIRGCPGKFLPSIF